METKLGSLGVTIPVQTLSASQEVKLTSTDVIAWRNHLHMADLGNTAKRVYQAISDCNKVKLPTQERFEILEILRPPVQFICQSLRKHYINLSTPITQQQLTIAQLAQTLQLEMALGYKLIVEQLFKEPMALEDPILLTALERILHYFTHIILRSYHLYRKAPEGIWHELYLLYQYADTQQLLKQNTLLNDYKRTFLLAGSFPYQWRQSEQDAIYQATETWCAATVLRQDLPNPSDPGFLVMDLKGDQPPLPSSASAPLSSSYSVLDITSLLSHLKTLLRLIEPNELQARLTHSNEPEYAVSASIVRGLIKEWSTPITRFQERKKCNEPVKICIGLTSTHYYVSGQRLFQSQQSSSGTESFSVLQTFSLPEETQVNTSETNTIDLGKTPMPTTETQISSIYPIYTCTLINEDSNEYGFIWQGTSPPPVQAGDVIGIERRDETGNLFWEVGKVHWLQHQTQNDFMLDVVCLSKKPKAAAIQLVKEGKSAGYSLRCLIFDSTIITPILPFKPKSHASIQDDTSTIEVELTRLIDATGSFKQFQFKIEQEASLEEPPMTSTTKKETGDTGKSEGGKGKFDSIWSNL